MIRLIINLIISLVVIISLCGIYIEANASEEWTEWTEAKYQNLLKIWFEPVFAKYLIVECKRTAKNPVKCIKIGASIAGAESSMWYHCYKYNCTWLWAGSITYKSVKEGVKDWVKRYNKYWYKQTSPNGFYPLKGKKSPTRYCYSEHSSRSKIGCPNGNKNAWSVWNKLTF